MSIQQLSSLHNALKNLAKGNHEVILNPTVGKILPTAINHIALNNKNATVEALLSQLSIATQAKNPILKKTAVSCLILTAKRLVAGTHWNQVKKIEKTLKLIADREDCDEDTRTDAKEIISTLESKSSGPKKKVVKSQKEKDPLKIEEGKIFTLAEKGESEIAKKKLFDLVVSCAKKKDFFNAERLRDRIYEIDSLALTEIIQLNKIIDTEKSASIGKHDLVKWTDLREKLSEEEFSRLFYSMEVRTLKPGTTFVTEGAQNDELYFISMGSVSVSYMDGESERILTTLKKGDIIGENFFDSSFWTVSLNTLELTKVMGLKRQVFEALERTIPELETILRDYYEGANDIKILLQKKEIERRKHERYKIERGIHVQVVGNKDRKPTHFKAKLRDISQGGLSFGIRITNKEKSRLLLGRGARISVPPAQGSTSKFLRGTIIGVQLQDLVTCDCSVHIKFTQELEYQSFKIFLY